MIPNLARSQDYNLNGFSASVLASTNFKFASLGGGIENYWKNKSIGITYTKSFENPFCILCEAPEPYKNSDRIEVNIAWYKYDENSKALIYFMTGFGYQEGTKRGRLIQPASSGPLTFFSIDEHEKVTYETWSVPVEVGWAIARDNFYPKFGLAFSINAKDFYGPQAFVRLNVGKVKKGEE